MDTPTAFEVGGGIIAGTGTIFAFLKWSLSRNLAEFDTSIAALKAGLAAQIAESRDRDLAIERRCMDDAQKAALADQSLASDLKHLSNALSSCQTLMQELQRLFETTRDKQSEFYRNEVRRLEERIMGELRRVEDLKRPKSR